MPDISIPGIGSSKYGSDKLVEGLMKIERVPRDKAAARLKSLQSQKTVWLDMNRKISSLRDDARNLFSFKNPFNARVAKSSNEEVVSATATREAVEQSRQILVKRAAAPDRFLSADLPKDYKVPAGDYAYSVGEKSVELRYGGGSLQDFADALARKGRDLIRASVVSVTLDTKALVIESQKSGSVNRLGFSGDAEKLGLDSGMLERVATRARDFDPTRPSAWEKPLDPASLAKSGVLSLGTGMEAKLSLPASTGTEGLTLELKYRLSRTPELPEPTRPTGPSLAPAGSATYEGFTIQSAPPETGMPEWTPPPRPIRVDDPGIAYLIGPDASKIALPPLEDGDEVHTLKAELGALIPELSALAFRNRDTARKLELVSARVYDPKEHGGFKPKRPISSAQDALVAMDGIEAIRPSNEISDLIPGVTLSVKEASDKPVRLKIEPDREAVKEAVIGLVGNYNRLMAQINILSRSDERLVSEIAYFTDEEKKTAEERLGLFQGDSTLSLLRTSLQRSMMNPYDTGSDSPVNILAQIGVATDARRPGAGQGYDVSRMRGYMEIEEESLDKALTENFESVRKLFGNDSDGDLLVDTGVAFSLDASLKPYVETGGIVSLKTRTIDTQIGTEKKTLENLDRQLITKEADLKRKYGMMESALGRMEGTSSSIDQFSSNNSGQ